MTDNNHPITPPPELIKQWLTEGHHQDYCSATEHAIAQAARWGADQELDACCKWLTSEGLDRFPMRGMLEARRPEPPTLKEQALAALSEADRGLNESEWQHCSDTIRRALEALPE